MRRWTQKVASSNILSVAYTEETRTLEVTFVSGRVYHYEVPKHLAEGMRDSSSPGGFFSEHIKGNYPERRAR